MATTYIVVSDQRHPEHDSEPGQNVHKLCDQWHPEHDNEHGQNIHSYK